MSWQWNGLGEVLDPWLAGEPSESRRGAVLDALAQLLDNAEFDLGEPVVGLPLARQIADGDLTITFVRVEQFTPSGSCRSCQSSIDSCPSA